MAKAHGLGDSLYVDGYNLSGDTNSLQRIAGGPAALVMQGIDKLAFERQGGHRDGGIDWTSYFNDAAGQAHPVLSALPRTDRIMTYLKGSTLGNQAACLNAKQVNYDATRADDGSLLFAVEGIANGFGLEWGVQLTAGARTDTGATAGTGVDLAASTSFGLQAYLQVTEFTGTDVTVKLQESSDNGSGDAYADVTGGAFAAITTDPQAQRIETARGLTVERWLRATTTTSGGFTSLSFVVVVMKNVTSVVF